MKSKRKRKKIEIVPLKSVGLFVFGSLIKQYIYLNREESPEEYDVLGIKVYIKNGFFDSGTCDRPD